MKKKILIIEDNENNMELMSFILKNSGYHVLKAFRGHDGIEMARTDDPDLVLLDIQLPDIDGFQVLKAIREQQGTANMRVIAVTSYAMTGDGRKLLHAGCNGYIEKPIDTDLIVRQVEEVLMS